MTKREFLQKALGGVLGVSVLGLICGTCIDQKPEEVEPDVYSSLSAAYAAAETGDCIIVQDHGCLVIKNCYDGTDDF